MFRAAPRLIARSTALPRTLAPARRYISTAQPTQKSRSWKSLVARFGIAGTIIYYYNTTDVFAEEPRQPVQALPETEVESEHLPTIESISAERQKRKAVQAQLEAQGQKEAQSAQRNVAQGSGGEGGIGGLEEEADQQGAFNPETGEINWDCPCLGGMATGPCGEEFKAAFSCFVFSEEEPKGMDCIDRFKDMQNCFRQYPEVYGSELESDAADDDELTADAAAPALDSSSQPESSIESAPAEKGKQSFERSSGPHSPEKVAENRRELGLVPDNYKSDAETTPERAKQAAVQTKPQEPTSESEQLVPKAQHDAMAPNVEKLERK